HSVASLAIPYVRSPPVLLFRRHSTPPPHSPFFFQCYGDHRDLHSFPTRRSSDLVTFTNKGIVGAGRLAHDKRDKEGETFGSLSRSEEYTSELQSRGHLVCRLLLEKKK